MRTLALPLILTMALAACESDPDFNRSPSTSVEVLGRTWTVTQVDDTPLTYRATRLLIKDALSGPPAATKTSQAIRALETATGCRVIQTSMYRNVSDDFFAQMVCN